MTVPEGFLPLGLNCFHCAGELLAKRMQTKGMELQGLANLEYRHLDGDRNCTRTELARPFDAWDATKAYLAARKAADEAIQCGR